MKRKRRFRSWTAAALLLFAFAGAAVLSGCQGAPEPLPEGTAEVTASEISEPTASSAAEISDAATPDATGSEATESETTVSEVHQHTYTSRTVEPTCTEKGYTTHTCTGCGDSYSDSEREALGHSYGKWVTTKNATCDADGVKSRGCTGCDQTETKDISATGHQWDDGEMTTVPSTCSDIGEKTYTCSACGKTKTEKVDGNHAFGEWLYEVYTFERERPTRPGHFTTATGRKKYHICSMCNKKEYDESIPHHACNSHIHTVLREGDCVVTRVSRWQCSICGYYEDVDQGFGAYHAAVSSKTEHLCDASYEYDALDVLIVECTACGDFHRFYTFTRSEPWIGKKFRLSLSVNSSRGDSYMQYHNPEAMADSETDALMKHPTWQDVERDFVYDDEGYVIAYTYIWHDVNGNVYSEVVDCSSKEALYKYFPSDFVDQYIDKQVSWELKVRGDHLVGCRVTWSGVA